MNIKYGSVCRVAVLNELGDRLAWHAPPLGAPQARQGRWGRGGAEEGSLGPAAEPGELLLSAPGPCAPACPQPGVRGTLPPPGRGEEGASASADLAF